MSKYNIDKTFGIIRNLKLPFNKIIVSIANRVLNNSYKCLYNRKDINIKTERIKVNNGFINIHIIIPVNCTNNNPCLFYLHGGGFGYDAQLHQYKNVARIATETGSIIVFPRYRLTPNVSNPTLLDDCYMAYKWLINNTSKYRIDPKQIGIGGDSAGGYLAARLTNIIVKEQKEILYQLLIYPVIDSNMQTKSMKKYIDTPMWNAKNNKKMWQWYYKENNKETSLLDELLPINIPNTYIETAQFDCLHDEGILYGNKLKSIKVDVTINETHRTMHGFDIINNDITKKALSLRIKYINKQIERR